MKHALLALACTSLTVSAVGQSNCAAEERVAPSMAPTNDRPNIVLIVADDLRFDAISHFAGRDLHTPNLDRLYEQGFTFTNTYAIGSNSGAVCAPSRAMIMTGRGLGAYWKTTKIDGVPSIPSLLKGAGYSTFGTGKWHQGKTAFAEGFEEGESIFFGGCIKCSGTSNTHNTKAKQASYEAKLQRINDEGAYEADLQPGVHVSDRFVDAAADFIVRQAASDDPYFVYCAFTAPHDPRVAPPEFDALFRDEAGVPTVRIPMNFLAEHPFDQGDSRIRDEILIDIPRDRDALAAEIADYYAMTAHMDAAIGRVVRAIDHADDARPTIVLFTSDHGLAIGSHGLMGKQNPYEHSFRAAPMVIAGPGVEHGATDSYAILNDLLPTVMAYAGVKAPDDLEGKSLKPVIAGDVKSVRDEVCFAYKGFSRAIRVGDWKLIRYPHLDRVQLFNLAADPHEMNSVHEDAAHARLIEQLSQRLAVWEQANRLNEKQK